MRIRFLVFTAAAVGTFASACTTDTDNTTCMTPAGNYRVEMKATSGNCPESLTKAFIESAGQTVTKASESCKTESFSTTNSFEVPEVGATCSAAVSGSKVSMNTGYTGTASLALTCSDNSTCQHAFTISFTKQ